MSDFLLSVCMKKMGREWGGAHPLAAHCSKIVEAAAAFSGKKRKNANMILSLLRSDGERKFQYFMPGIID